MFLHSFGTEKICSASRVVENVQLSDLSLMARKNKELFFSVAKYASGKRVLHNPIWYIHTQWAITIRLGRWAILRDT